MVNKTYEINEYNANRAWRPSDWTYKDSPYIEELNAGYVAQMKKLTIYEIAE
jgi:hypothetical protein